MRYGHVGWVEFNAMRPAESMALAKALTELLKQEDQMRAALAGVKVR